VKDIIDHGCDLLLALRFARRQGCSVRQARGSGDVFGSHPAFPGRRLRVSGHRKDAPPSLTSYLLKLRAGAPE
jgi:hypothetical protein